MADRKNKALKNRAPKKMPSTDSSRASAVTNAIAGEGRGLFPESDVKQKAGKQSKQVVTA
jgi:hypothetical protein